MPKPKRGKQSKKVLPKCIHCSIDLNEDFQLIFDETGLELELQKLLGICFDLDVKIRLDTIQALCIDCLNKLIETYDIIQRDKEKRVSENIESPVEGHNDDSNEPFEDLSDPLAEAVDDNNDLNMEDTSMKQKVSSPLRSSINTSRKRKHLKLQTPLNSKKRKSLENSKSSSTENESNSESKDKKSNRKKSQETSKNETQNTSKKRRNNISRRKNIGEMKPENSSESEFVDIENDSENESRNETVNESENPDEIDGITIEHADFNFNEYKRKALRTQFKDVFLPQGIQCRLCDENLTSHVDITRHTEETHCVEDFAYPCIIDKECENATSAENLSFHLVFQHYDLASLIINTRCPECNKPFPNFLDFNRHSCMDSANMLRTKVDCEKCGKSFRSTKRYRFHLQFHEEKHRPMACFICDKFYNDINKFFDHIMYTHDKNVQHACKRCDRIFCKAESLENHNNWVHSVKGKFSCKRCSKSYKEKSTLDAHMIVTHGQGNHFKCKVCGKILFSEITLRNHMSLHIEINPAEVFYCSCCGVIGQNKKEVQNHIKIHKNQIANILNDETEMAYCCQYCEAAYKTIAQLKEHREEHQKKIFYCSACKATFEKYGDLHINHIRKHADYVDRRKHFPVARHYVCDWPQCEKTYALWKNFYSHKIKHKIVIKCMKCNEKFKTSDELTKHTELIHADANFSCQFCDKTFLFKQGLSSHLNMEHYPGKFLCDQCESRFPTEAKLRAHNKIDHSDKPRKRRRRRNKQGEFETPLEPPLEPPHCKECNLYFKSTNLYNRHVRAVHNKEKRYFCIHCEKGFFRNFHRIKHEKSHFTIHKCHQCPFTTKSKDELVHHKFMEHFARKLTCDLCKKSFSNLQSYKRHMKVHYNIKDFVCPYNECEYVSVDRQDLRKHLTRRHNDKNHEFYFQQSEEKGTISSLSISVIDDDNLGTGIDSSEMKSESYVEQEYKEENECIDYQQNEEINEDVKNIDHLLGYEGGDDKTKINQIENVTECEIEKQLNILLNAEANDKEIENI